MAATDIAGSILRHPRFDYLAADDPLPFLYDLRSAAASVLGGDEAEPERDPGEPPFEPGIDAGPDPERVEEGLNPMAGGGDDGDTHRATD